MAGYMKPEAVHRAVQSIPLGRLGMPEDVAYGVVFFACPEAEWITGEVMDINGGFVID
jgi:3-oxoacyl-[acyl-carrier protein] reductase